MDSRRARVTLFCLALLLPAAGCGHERVGRLPVHGMVKTSAGATLEASITFLPADGENRPAATAGVVNGEYSFDRSNGPTAGRTEVRIRRIAARENVGRLPARGKPPGAKLTAPSRTEWIRKVDVADDGKYQHDFTLDE